MISRAVRAVDHNSENGQSKLSVNGGFTELDVTTWSIFQPRGSTKIVRRYTHHVFLHCRFDLELNVRVVPDAVLGRFCFNADILDLSTVERMARHYRTLLEAASAHPKARLSDVRILDDEERHRVLVEWNDTAVDLPRDDSIHGLFEGAAARDGQAVAVIYGEERLTYGELRIEVLRVARGLLELGVKKGDRVGVWATDNIEWVVLQLATAVVGAVLDVVTTTDEEKFVPFRLTSLCESAVTVISTAPLGVVPREMS